MSDDVVARAKAALEGRPVHLPDWRVLANLVPELVAEVERLRMAEVERKR